MGLQVTIIAENAADLHAQMLAIMGRSAPVAGIQPQPAKVEQPSAAEPKAEEPPTAEVVPIAERKKPGRPPKKPAETVIENKPEAPATATVEEARAVLSDIKSKIGMEEARQLNKKHGDQPLNDKTPEQWAAIVAEGKTILKALED